MSEPLKKPGHAPESYDPKDVPEIVKLAAGRAQAQAQALASDTIADPFAGGEPPRTSNRITDYRRIQNWENYFLASAICSVAKLVGFDEEALTMFAEKNGNKGMHFFSAITGDMFAPMYDTLDEKPADSGYTACFFAPQVIKRAFAAFGRDCVYLSAAYIKENLRTVTNACKASIDKGIPVLSWGWGVVTLGDWHGDMPEGCLVGGYENDQLCVQLYPGPERMAVDGDGYYSNANGLLGSKGLFFVGEPIEKTPLPQVYREALAAIPARLTMPPAEGIVFGKAAFDQWADNLLDETNFTGKTEEEINGLSWSLHCKSFCNVCTSDAECFIRAAAKEGIAIAGQLLPLYERFFKCKDKIWKISGGFGPPAKKFRQRKFREKIAALLREMGAICGEIVAVFEGGIEMSEPLRKPGHAPESYDPKDVPEIVKMAGQGQASAAIDGAPEPFSEQFGVFQLPASRVIGMERRFKLGGSEELLARPLWDEAFASELWKTVQALPQLIPNSNCGWTCDSDAETDTFSYLSAVLCPAGTPVPEGCQFRDIPPTKVAAGLWGDDMQKVIKRMKKLGFVTNYEAEDCGWNAELYFLEEHDSSKRRGKGNIQGCRWLVPCRPKKEGAQ